MFAIVFGFAWGGNNSTKPAIVADSLGVSRLGTIMGIMGVSFGIGAAIGPFMGGFIFDLSSNYDMAFLIGAIILLVSVPGIALVRRETGVSAPAPEAIIPVTLT